MPPKKQYQWNPGAGEIEDDRPSRSQKKRDSTALQRLGEELSALSPAILRKMPITPAILDSILEWQQLTSHESRRRQMQYVGRLMREEGDPEAVRTALDGLGYAEATVAFKELEQFRDELLVATPEDLDTLLAPYANVAELRELVEKTRNEREHKRPPHAYRALFRALRDAANENATKKPS